MSLSSYLYLYLHLSYHFLISHMCPDCHSPFKSLLPSHPLLCSFGPSVAHSLSLYRHLNKFCLWLDLAMHHLCTWLWYAFRSGSGKSSQGKWGLQTFGKGVWNRVHEPSSTWKYCRRVFKQAVCEPRFLWFAGATCYTLLLFFRPRTRHKLNPCCP